jgi:hypothetical protein
MGVGFVWDGSVPGAIWEDGDATLVDLFDGFFVGGTITADYLSNYKGVRSASIVYGILSWEVIRQITAQKQTRH